MFRTGKREDHRILPTFLPRYLTDGSFPPFDQVNEPAHEKGRSPCFSGERQNKAEGVHVGEHTPTQQRENWCRPTTAVARPTLSQPSFRVGVFRPKA